MLGHKCTKVVLKVLTMLHEEVRDEEEDLRKLEILGETMLQTIKLFVGSTIRLILSKIMKVKGIPKGEALVILIINGASHNFVSNELISLWPEIWGERVIWAMR